MPHPYTKVGHRFIGNKYLGAMRRRYAWHVHVFHDPRMHGKGAVGRPNMRVPPPVSRPSEGVAMPPRFLEWRRCMQSFVRRYCLVRDARVLLLRLQWQRWEAEHIRRLTTEARSRQLAAGTRPRDGDGARPGGRDNAAEEATTPDHIKTTICRQCGSRPACSRVCVGVGAP